MRSVKNIVCFILLLIISTSCSEEKNGTEKIEAKNKSEKIVDKPVLNTNLPQESLDNFLDTLHIKNKIYHLHEISKKYFSQIPPANSLKTKSDLKNVSYQDSTSITFSLSNGLDTTFTNNYEDGWENYSVYEVIKDYDEINCWLVYIGLYEGDAMFLLNKNSGKVLWIYSEPILSPSKKYFVSHSGDLEAGYNSNGIQLFKIQGANVVEIWTKDIAEWEPSEVKWENDSTIAIKQTFFNWDNTEEFYIYKYKTMKVINMHNRN